jgi:hypothetical protein
VRLQLYTVPGQVFYNVTRRLVLKGVDGVVFVADSQVPALEPNEESLGNLRQNLEELGVDPRDVPLVFQYNKRDLRNILPIEKLQQALNPGGAPSFEAAAIHGVGVFECLKEISRLSLDSVRKRVAPEEQPGMVASRRRRAAAPVPKAAPTPSAPAAAAPAATSEASPDPALMEPLQVEFAEEDTDKVQVRPVRTKGSLDIGKELEKLRAMTAESKLKTPTAVRDRDVDRLFKDLVPSDRDAQQEMTRKAAIEVPAHLLKGLSDLRIHLGFDRDGREEVLRDAARVTLVRTRRLHRLSVHLDLDINGKE